MELTKVDPRLAAFIATRDRRIAKQRPWSRTPLAEAFNELLLKGVVCMGGRSTCGTSVDPTWVEFRLWNEVVSKAVKLGYRIDASNIKHGNSWATKAGGFWEEREYRLLATEAA